MQAADAAAQRGGRLRSLCGIASDEADRSGQRLGERAGDIALVLGELHIYRE